MNEMNNPFEKIVRGSAPEVPDAGNTRRTNRALMQERIRRDVPRRKRKYRLGLAAAGLALVVLFSRQVDDVGSDGWDLETKTESNLLGQERQVFSRPFSGGTVSGPKSTSETQARDIKIAEMTNDFKILRVTGLEIHGKTRWLQMVETTADGEITTTGWGVNDPASQSTPDHDEILATDLYREIMASRKNPPDQENNRVTLDGITYEVKTWEFKDTHFGLVKYHLGLPIR